MGVFNTILVLEMLFVNLYTFHACSKQKKSTLITWTYLVIFTVLFNLVLFQVRYGGGGGNGGNGNGVFMIIGFIYIIPLKYLYDHPLKHSIIIMSSSWIYTMLVFSLSIRVGYFFSEDWLFLSACLFQTILYAITLPSFLKFVRGKFIYTLRNFEDQMINFLLVQSLLWLILVNFLTYIFVEGTSPILGFIIIIVVAGNALLSYKLFYSSVFLNKTAQILTEKIKYDPLTKLKSRESMNEDALNKIGNGLAFTIVFIDLDNFKGINDNYGHSIGDAYLIEFAKTIKEVFNSNDGFYRMSGDEFVFLVESQDAELICSKLENLEFMNNPSGVEFRGLSSGYASYPEDGNDLRELLHLADFKMYQEKKEKHRGVPLTT